MEFSELLEQTFSSWHNTCRPVSESIVGTGGKIFVPLFGSRKLSELSSVSKVWNIKFTANWILESTIVVPSFPIYFSSSLFSSANGALESPCSFCLQKKMLNRANPFDTAHEAQTAHFKTSGTLATLVHLYLLDLQIYLA